MLLSACNGTEFDGMMVIALCGERFFASEAGFGMIDSGHDEVPFVVVMSLDELRSSRLYNYRLC